jgi:monovalent cation/proton antiporter MnhG/PhaG subunit
VTVRGIAEHVLLWAGVACELVCVLGLLLMRRALDRLHFAAASTTVGVVLIVAAVLVRESFGQSGINAIVVGAVLLFVSPVLAHATARVAQARRDED